MSVSKSEHELLVSGFSKFSKQEKIDWLVYNFTNNPAEARSILEQYWNPNSSIQSIHDEFIENTLTNFYLPWGIAPNFVIDGEIFAVPMAIEESSVVAAASKTAKFWADMGGFKTEIVGTVKVGHVHFIYKENNVQDFFDSNLDKFYQSTNSITVNMRNRGGGIKQIKLIDKTDQMASYYQLEVTFETVDSMGANFINSCLEAIAQCMKSEIHPYITHPDQFEVVMSILSNYTPECVVKTWVEAPIEQMRYGGVDGEKFVEKFAQAIHIAKIDPYRATTHNKGIYNGIDSVVLATGNDFRAVEAAGHAYASRDGQYRSLTDCEVKDGVFKFWLEVPMALGTVGGITGLHPMVKLSLDILNKPSATTLMKVASAVGLTQNFAAVGSLVTTGIQQGHMKMHLLNILNQLGANAREKEVIVDYFRDKTVSFHEAKKMLDEIRN